MKKIRNIHRSTGFDSDEIALEDVIQKLIDASKPMAKLEIENSKKAYSEARDLTREAYSMLKELRHRLRYEVLPEINEYYSKRKPNYKGNAENFKK